MNLKGGGAQPTAISDVAGDFADARGGDIVAIDYKTAHFLAPGQ
jgi:hypothetical protein